MPWGPLITLGTFTEASAGAGVFSDWIALNPGEKAEVHIARVDGSPTEPWIWRAFGSPDQVLLSDLPGLSYRLKVARLKLDRLISGPPNFQIFVQNADGSPVDSVRVTIKYKLDGVHN